MVTWGDISGFIDNIKSALWGWVDDIARYWVQRAYEFYDILRHSWSDVLDAVENAKAYDVVVRWVKPLFESARSYAEDIVSNALNIVDNLINDIWNNIDNVWDSINNIFNVQIPDLRNSIQSAWDWINNVDIWIDTKINEFKDRILGWVEEGFITIVEHVLEMNIGGKR